MKRYAEEGKGQEVTIVVLLRKNGRKTSRDIHSSRNLKITFLVLCVIKYKLKVISHLKAILSFAGGVTDQISSASKVFARPVTVA